MSTIRTGSGKPSFRRYEPALRKVAKKTLKEVGAKGCGLDILIIDAAGMKRLNKKFRGTGRATDVLSFSAREGVQVSGDKKFLGDVAICFDIAMMRSRKANADVLGELSLYLIHGILHLLGWEHKIPQDKIKMEQAQLRILSLCREGR